MCGVAGIIHLGSSASKWSETKCRAMSEVLSHRGPDHFGYWQGPNLTLFHWRLAIIDTSSAGNQPMVSRCGRYILTYNGEIYNFQDLKGVCEEDREKGSQWVGHSDTEVLLEAISQRGEDCFSELNGMFAFSFYDTQKEELILVRDRIGIKPLYYWSSPEAFIFASEPKFFLSCEEFRARVSPQGLKAFLLYGHGFGDCRFIEGVKQLQPGHYLRIPLEQGGDTREPQCSRYVAAPAWAPRRRTVESAAKEVRRLIEKSVERQLISDVPVGVFLSGGVDSSILAAVASKILGPEKTKVFTLGYKGYGKDFDEISVARDTANHLGATHHILTANEKDLLDDFERMVWYYDEPFADGAALNVMVLSKLVRQHVTVALAGEGSDELFGGYRRYRLERLVKRMGLGTRSLSWIAKGMSKFPIGLPRRVQILLRSIARDSASERYSAYFEASIAPELLVEEKWRSEEDVREFLGTIYPGSEKASALAAMCLADQQFWLVDSYLEKSDKASMSHSLEIRVPFLDNEIVEFANTLPDDLRLKGRQGKRILRYAFSDILPENLFTRFKRGFAVPYSRWLRNELNGFFRDRVLGPSAKCKGIIQEGPIRRLLEEHERKGADHSVILWRLLVLEVWLRQIQSGLKNFDAEMKPRL